MSRLGRVAHGRAAHAVLRWLHRKPIAAISIWKSLDHDAEPEPQRRHELEEAICTTLGTPVGEMLHLGVDARHLSADREDVKRALRLAGSLGDGDPVDLLEPHFHDVCATLSSPRIAHAVRRLAGALMRAPGGAMDAERAKRVIAEAVKEELPAGAYNRPAPPRRIHVMPPQKARRCTQTTRASGRCPRDPAKCGPITGYPIRSRTGQVYQTSHSRGPSKWAAQ